MAVLGSQVEASDRFEERRARMEALVAELRERSAGVAPGGGGKAAEEHHSRGESAGSLVAPAPAFVERSALAGWAFHDNGAGGLGMVTGIGTIEGRECV